MRGAPYLAAILALAGILAGRILYDMQIPPGGAPYLFARLARTFFNRGVITSDHLVVGGALIHFTPYHTLLTIVAYGVGDLIASILVPFLFAMLALVAINRFLTQLGRPFLERTLTLFIIATSPTFLYDATTGGQRMAIIAFQLLSASLLLNSSTIYRIAGLGAAILASIFSPLAGLLTILLCALSLLYHRRPWLWISAVFISVLIGATISSPETLNSEPQTGFASTLSDLGSIDGLPTFSLILGAVGLWILYPDKKISLAIFALVIGSFVDHQLISPANVALAALSGAGIIFLVNRSWKIRDLKSLSLLVITCGLLFSSVSAGMRLGALGPTKEMTESLLWLRGHSRSGEVVLSSPVNGHWIQYFAIRPVIVDERITDTRLQDSIAIFHSYNINNVEDYFKTMNVSYVYITPDMTQGQVWNAKNQGLYYLLSNDETFKNIYRKNHIEIYEFIKNYPPR